jgi:hypothetical protein
MIDSRQMTSDRIAHFFRHVSVGVARSTWCNVNFFRASALCLPGLKTVGLCIGRSTFSLCICVMKIQVHSCTTGVCQNIGSKHVQLNINAWQNQRFYCNSSTRKPTERVYGQSLDMLHQRRTTPITDLQSRFKHSFCSRAAIVKFLSWLVYNLSFVVLLV